MGSRFDSRKGLAKKDPWLTIIRTSNNVKDYLRRKRIPTFRTNKMVYLKFSQTMTLPCRFRRRTKMVLLVIK